MAKLTVTNTRTSGTTIQTRIVVSAVLLLRENEISQHDVLIRGNETKELIIPTRNSKATENVDYYYIIKSSTTGSDITLQSNNATVSLVFSTNGSTVKYNLIKITAPGTLLNIDLTVGE